MPLINIILEEVILRLGISDLTEAEMDNYRKQLIPIVQDRILNVYLDSLDGEETAILMSENPDEAAFEKVYAKITMDPERQKKINASLEALIDELSSLPS